LSLDFRMGLPTGLVGPWDDFGFIISDPMLAIEFSGKFFPEIPRYSEENWLPQDRWFGFVVILPE